MYTTANGPPPPASFTLPEMLPGAAVAGRAAAAAIARTNHSLRIPSPVAGLEAEDDRAGEDVVGDLRAGDLHQAQVLDLGDHVPAEVEAQAAGEAQEIRQVQVGEGEQV